MRNYIVVPDLHCPYVDWAYVDAVSQLIALVQPEGLIQLGDFSDFYKISSFCKDPKREESISQELEMYNRILDIWLELMPDGSILHQLEGNHEDRLRRFIWNRAPELADLIPSIPDLLEFDTREREFGVIPVWHPYEKWNSCQIGDTVFHHGFYYNKHVAVMQSERYPVNIVTGHTHRYQQVRQGTRWSATLGHGSYADETMHKPVPSDWWQYVGLFTCDDYDRGNIEAYPVVDGHVVVRGRTIQGIAK